VDVDERGYVFASELTGELPWLAEAVTRRVGRAAAQAGVSVNVSGLRRYSMTRLSALGVPVDVIAHRMGVSIRAGAFPLFGSFEALVAADRDAAVRLGRDLDQAVALAAGRHA